MSRILLICWQTIILLLALIVIFILAIIITTLIRSILNGDFNK